MAVTSSATPTKGAQTRQSILDAAIARFGREGFRATSVADIARDASVGGTVPYAYFADKEALFLAALDEDAAAVINEGLSSVFENPGRPDWRQTLLFTLVTAVDRHPLARRLLAGLEPDVTDRVLEIPALSGCAVNRPRGRCAPTSTPSRSATASCRSCCRCSCRSCSWVRRPQARTPTTSPRFSRRRSTSHRRPSRNCVAGPPNGWWSDAISR